ncbi:MAG TPA: glycosyltransferase [Solirubrobacterales bacterium]|nr:glycosyltransferase [Solirubrobacterales bacterium]
MVERLILLQGDQGHIADGIRDHTARIAEELPRHRVAAARLRVRVGEGRGLAGSLRLWRSLRNLPESSAVLVQYSPFCFGRWGFAPWLPAYLWAIGRRRRGPAVAVMVHEPYVPMVSWRWTLMGLWQRLQLALLRLSADVVFASIEPWASEFEALPPWRPVHHLPVGSNFPDGRSERELERRRLGLGEDTVVLCCLGRDHQTWLGEEVVETANAVARSRGSAVLVTLGAYAPDLSGLDPAVETVQPGYLEPERFAAALAASDVFLAPVSDGVSTRRGSLMAALQHGLPVVGTDGALTDPVLRRSTPALALAPVGDRDRFTASAVRLAEDREARAAAAAAARDLYEREFDWGVIAERLLAGLPQR